MTVIFQDRTIETADAWDALPVGKQQMAYQIIMSDMASVIDPVLELPFKRMALMQLLTDITDEDLAQLYLICIQEHGLHGHFIHANIVEDMCVCTDFLFTTLENGQKAISPTLFACPYPGFTGDGDRPSLYCAGDAFNNISFYELTLIFELYNEHTKTDDPSVVLELLATLYRPAKEATSYNIQSGYEGDIRQPILKHEAMVEARKEYMKWLPDNAKRLILFWVASCMDKIVKQNAQLFQRSQEQFERTRDYGWAAVLLKLSGGVIHLDAVATQPFENVLTYLNMLEDERFELENAQH